jgi:hypothetical protein
VQADATPSNAQTGGQRQHVGAQYSKVFDQRKRRIRGFIYHRQLGFQGLDSPNLPPAPTDSRLRPPKTRENWLEELAVAIPTLLCQYRGMLGALGFR